MKALYFSLLSLLFIIACSNEPNDTSHNKNESNGLEELVIGTWIKSISLPEKTIEIGFKLREDHIVDYINQSNSVGQEWIIKEGDSLQLYYQNRVFGDSVESRVYFIESVGPEQMTLIPRGALTNYKEIYTRK
jgi:hypothetical protein